MYVIMLLWIALHTDSDIGLEDGPDHDELLQSTPNETVRTQYVPFGSVVQSLIRMASLGCLD